VAVGPLLRVAIWCGWLTGGYQCEQCAAKGSECTSLYIEQLQSKQKKGRKRSDGEHGAKRRRSDEEMAPAGQGSEGNDSPGIRRPSLVSTYHVGESSR
jgi:hypothetical protein